MEKFSLTGLAREQLTLARDATSGRRSHTVYGGHEHVLRQTLIAVAAGQKLAEHENPGEATVHVLRGRVSLGSDHCGMVLGAPTPPLLADLLRVIRARADAPLAVRSPVRATRSRGAATRFVAVVAIR